MQGTSTCVEGNSYKWCCILEVIWSKDVIVVRYALTHQLLILHGQHLHAGGIGVGRISHFSVRRVYNVCEIG